MKNFLLTILIFIPLLNLVAQQTEPEINKVNAETVYIDDYSAQSNSDIIGYVVSDSQSIKSGGNNTKDEFNMCGGINTTTDPTGTLYDSGGPTGSYTNGENCSFLIDPGCAVSITLSFNSFHLEGCCDYFKAYDGTDQTGTLLMSANGSSLPDPVTAYSGAMYITFTSDGSVTYPGWEAIWSSEIPAGPPAAEFSISDENPPYNSIVEFTDLTTNMPNSWSWDFGDGNTSDLQNPTHAYSTMGTHVVTLISDNCYSTDTVSHTLVVQDVPIISVEPNNLNLTFAECVDSTIVPLTIFNAGDGALNINIESESTSEKETIELLALTYGVDYYQEYANTLEAINQYFTDYNLTETNTTEAAVLQSFLSGKDVLLIAEQESGSSYVFAGFSVVLNDFVNNGGSVIFCGTSNYDCINSTDLLSIYDLNSSYGSTLTVLDDTHPITAGLPSTFLGTDATFTCNFTDSDIVNLVHHSADYYAVSYREIGLGKVIYVGFDYFSYNDEGALLIANAVAWSEVETIPEWFSFSPDSAYILPGDSVIIDCNFNSSGLESGFYSHELYVNSNDPVSPSVFVPVYLTVEGSSEITLSEETMNLGPVMTEATKTEELIIYNTGCQTLIIDEFITSNSVWTVNMPSMVIPPFNDDTLLVSFTPTIIADYMDTLFIYNGETLTTVELVGMGVGAPAISIDPESLDISFADCDESSDIPLTIYNIGVSLLEFETMGGYGISFDSTSTIYYYTFGATTEHVFSGLTSLPDTLAVEVTLNGDFDSSSEYATLWIEDTYIEQITDWDVPNGTDIIAYYEFTGDILTTWLANNQLNVSVQNSNAVDVDMGGFNYHKVRLIMNGIEWLTVSPESGEINAGDSLEVMVNLDGEGLLTGNYSSEIYINSNDPVTPVIEVPIELEIIGTPEIALSQECMDFGTILENASLTDSIKVFNNGCNTLIINDLITSLPEFDATINLFEILPGDTASLFISFSPTSIGNYLDTLFIYSNEMLIEFCLAGTAMEAPVITVNPTSFNINIDACEGYAESIMYIGNEGGSNLTYEILGSGSSGTIELLALTYGVDYYGEYLNTLAAINQYFTDYNLTEIYTTIPVELENSLIDKDVLLIAEQEDGSSDVFAGFNSVLMDFVNNGGCIVYCGATNYSCLAATDLFTVTSYSNAWEHYLDVLDNTHPITEGLPSQLYGPNAVYTYNITDADAVKLIEDNSSPYYDVLTYREIGSGIAIFIAYDYYDYDDHAAQIVARAVEWGAFGVLPSWLSVSPETGIVLPANSIETTLTFNSTGMDGGVYESNLTVVSNDPVNSSYTIPVVMNVSYNPCADFTFSSEGCNGVADFSDATTNNPVIWQWDFGDEATSNIQNPSHTYENGGNYTVQLIACNSTDCDTISYVVPVESTFGPIEAICYPETNYGYTYQGINNVTFNTINNTTGGSIDGYQDYTCTDYTYVVQGMSYEISVENFDEESVRVWIDYNNNGEFEEDEMIMDSPAYYIHNETITISSYCTVGVGLRMRVGSESDGYSPPEPCQNSNYGQFEDYTVIIEANTIPPVAMFEYNIIDECQGIIHFSDMSLNLPTSWLWEFGDGLTSTYQNPYHTFTVAGIYTIGLTVTNEYGSNYTTMQVLVNSLYPVLEIDGEFQIYKPMTFNSNTIGAISWFWEFGDGYSSNLQNPTYTYTQVGYYTVSLTVQNGVPCASDIYEEIYIDFNTGIDNPDDNTISIYPNPAHDFFMVNIGSDKHKEIGLKMYDSYGRVAASYEMDITIDGYKRKINTDKLEKGMYSIQAFDTGTGEIIYTTKLVVY